VDNVQSNLTRLVDIDFEANRRAQLALIQQRWPGNWNDFLASNFGMLLVDLMAWNVTTMAYLINRQASELFKDTMTLRESAIRLGALGGYRLRGPSPATVACNVLLANTSSSNITIAKGTPVQASTGQVFEVSQDYVILAGATTPVTQIAVFSPEAVGTNVLATLVKVTPNSRAVDLVDSSIDLTQYVSPGQEFRLAAGSAIYTIASLSKSDGAISNNRLILTSPFVGTAVQYTTAEVIDRRVTLTQGQTLTEQISAPGQETENFSITLGRTPVIDNSISVLVNNEPRSEVASPIDLTPTSKSFLVKTTTKGSTVVQFGDNQLGLAVPINSLISLTYRVGGGSDGNIAAGTITSTLIGLVSSTQNPVTITLSNANSAGQGGTDEETLEEARIHIPLAIKANDRIVTLSDCQEVARAFSNPQFGRVAFARAFARASNSVLESNIINLYAWMAGTDGSLTTLPSAMKLALRDWLTSRSLGTDYIIVMDGTSRPAPISIRFKGVEGIALSDTIQLVHDTLKTAMVALRPGDPIILSTLINTLSNVHGVSSLILATPNDDLVTANPTELFTTPNDSYSYTVTMDYTGDVETATDGVRLTLYSVQLPVSPLTPWSFQLWLGNEALTIMPGIQPGTARLYNPRVLGTDDNYPSIVNLLTGQVSIYTKGIIGDLTMQLKTVQGYTTERTVNIYASYIGLNSAEKRQEIRTRLKSWGAGLTIGGTLFSREVTGVAASKSNATSVIEATSDVDQVTNLTLGTTISTDTSVTAGEAELLKLGHIILNGSPS